MLSNINIADAKICIEGQDRSIGRGLFTTHDLDAGEQIYALKRPLVGSLDSHRLPDTCANCYTWTEGSSNGMRLYVPEGTKAQKCAGCQRFRYCSKICQEEAWHRGHKHECKILRPGVGREIPKAVLACIELLSRRKHGLIRDEEWVMLLQLQTHVDDFKKNGSYSNIELMAMAASQFSLTQNMFDKDFVAAMYARVLSNSLTLITPTFDPLGIILDPILASINHSCEPNAFVVMDGAEVAMRTLKPVKKDEEIYISYIDTSNPYHRRQSELKTRWFFECHCTKCRHGATLDEDRWAIEPKKLSERFREIGIAISSPKSYTPSPANYVGDSSAEKLIAAIQGEVFEQFENAQSFPPEEALLVVQDAMQMCHDSKLWPLYRQPYAALRDELIVNLLSTGKFSEAWLHCTRRYKYILPKLYPVRFHPVRVVQTWQIAMLAAYLASTPGSIEAPGANMGLIAMMLVKQVLDLAAFSHGTTSAFTRSVRGKAEEMMEELKRSLGGYVDNEGMNRELETQRDVLVEMGDWAKI